MGRFATQQIGANLGSVGQLDDKLTLLDAKRDRVAGLPLSRQRSIGLDRRHVLGDIDLISCPDTEVIANRIVRGYDRVPEPGDRGGLDFFVYGEEGALHVSVCADSGWEQNCQDDGRKYSGVNAVQHRLTLLDAMRRSKGRLYICEPVRSSPCETSPGNWRRSCAFRQNRLPK